MSHDILVARMKNILDQAPLNQKELAEKLEVHEEQLCRWLEGKNKMRRGTEAFLAPKIEAVEKEWDVKV